MLLEGCRVVLSSGVVERGFVRVAGGRISEVGEGDPPPGDSGSEERVGLPRRTLVPGFVDIHVHGGGGGSFTAGDPQSVARARDYHLARGTTRCLASLVTAPAGELARALSSLAELSEDGVISGVHLEGPFLSPERAGAQDPRHLIEPDLALFAELLEAGRGSLRMVTVAPELPGAIELIKEIAAAGVVAAIGHSNADYPTARVAIEAGATVATHVWTAMRPIHHRDPGVIGAVLADRQITCELISDGLHIHPAVALLTARLAGDRLALVSDAVSAAGEPDGTYRLGELETEVRGGRSYLAGTETIAGSTATLGEGLRCAVRQAGLSLSEAVTAASSRPAEVIGADDEVGTIDVGKLADLVVLDEDLRVEAVISSGRWLSE